MQRVVDSSNFRRFRRKIDCFQPAVLDVSESAQIFGDFGEKMSVSNRLLAKSAGYDKLSEISAKNECFQPACKEWWSVQIFGDFGEKANQCKMLFILTLS